MSKKKLLSGHMVEPMTEEEKKKMKESGFVLRSLMVRLQPDGWLLPDVMANKYLDKVYNFKFRPDDVIVMSSPKCGTTWMQEILWTMANNPDLTHPRTNTPILNRSPDISFDFVFDSIVSQVIKFDSIKKWFAEVCPERKEEDGIMLQIAELMPERRIIKCHLPLNLLPPGVLDTAKVVYTIRNPKDAIVSYYKMLNSTNIPDDPNIHGPERPNSLDAFARGYMDVGFIFSPHWRHVQLAWEQRNHPNLCFVFFEELKTDTKKQLRRLNDFIGTELTESQLDAVEHHTSFMSIKERGDPMKDGLFKNFFRKGTTGDWKEYFTPELKADMDKWIEENTSKIGITHKWD